MSIDPKDVPQAVKDAVKTHFPDVEVESWEAETQYEAEFTRDGRDVEANFTSDGMLLQVETEVDVETLPKAVLDAVRRDFPKARIREAELVETPGADPVYELDLEEDGAEIEVHVAVEARIVAIGDDL